jgi:outer membrane protein OmpA-like peptidoglycan-associated protein
MRSSWLIAALFIASCASAEQKQACHPVSSLMTPAFRCGVEAPPPPPPVVEEEEPPPEEPEEPEPPPPPPPVEIVGDDIQLQDTIQFEPSSAVLVDDSKILLMEVAKVLDEHPEILKVSIEGHTDADGARKKNQKLSEKRAKAVKDFLVSKGIAKGRLTTKGFGEDKPIADNDSADGKFKNRRVELKITKRE